MKKHKPWYLQEKLWKYIEFLDFDKERWKKAKMEVDDIAKLINISSSAKILYLCCGPGRHSLEFARRGFIVTGVDITRYYLSKAKKLAKKEKLDIEFIRCDARKFVRPNYYDVVINLFTSFGYFEKESDDIKVVKNIYTSLKTKGIFIIDIPGKEHVIRNFSELYPIRQNGLIIIEDRKLTNNCTRIDNRTIVLLKNKKWIEFKYSLRLYSSKELYDLLKQYGFNNVHIYGDLQGGIYNHTAKRLVAVARK